MRLYYAGRYVVARGLRGMAQAPLVQTLAVATIAVCMLLLGATVLAWQNAQAASRAWGVDVPVTVYLVDDADPAAVDALADRIRHVAEVEAVEHIQPAEAMERLADGLGGAPEIVAGITVDVMPASLEVHLASAAWDVGPQLAAHLSDNDVVEEVLVADASIGEARAMLETLRQLAAGAGFLVAVACLAIVASTIRLAVYARRSEVEILRLVGGTAAFVHGPFLVAGMLQGVLGVGLALILLYVGFDAIEPFMSRGLAFVFAADQLRFFTVFEIAAALAGGALLGVIGSRAAVARYVPR